MSNRNRKIRKAISKGLRNDPALADVPDHARRAVQFRKAPKVGTPLHERSYLTRAVPAPVGTRYEGRTQTRSVKKAARYLAARVFKKDGE